MFVYDLRTRALLFQEHVSHGRNSGANVPTAFSNEPESFKSSIGLYRTAEGYFGKHGYSLRLDGLEKGFNDRARERAIVIHGADYVNAEHRESPGPARTQPRLPGVETGDCRKGDRHREGGRAGVRLLSRSRLARLLDLSQLVAPYFQPVDFRVNLAGIAGLLSAGASGSPAAAAISRSRLSAFGSPAS